MSVFDKSLITILVCNAVFSLLSIPLIIRIVPRNPIYGYRTEVTMEDEKLWYKANAYLGIRLLVASILSACLAVAVDELRGISPAIYLKVSIVLLVAPVAATWLLTARFVRKIGAGYQSSNDHS